MPAELLHPPEPLREIQTGFSACLLDAERQKPEDVVAPARNKQAEKRFGVYRNNVIVSLSEALMDSFPTILALVGDEFFRALARLYVSEHPPKSAMLIEYGQGFPDFLQSFPPMASLPFAADTARLEYAWIDAYHASDAPAMSTQALSEIPEDQLADITLQLHPAARLITSAFPIFSIWASHREGNPEEVLNNLPQEAQSVLITRPQWDVEVICLPEGGEAFISALMQNKSLSQAAETAASANPNFDLAQNLGGLLQTGALLDARAAP